MAFKVTNHAYDLTMISGDTEYIHLNIKDSVGSLDTVNNYQGVMDIKRKKMDTDFVIPEKAATMSAYSAEDPYNIEFRFSDEDTAAILNYNGVERKEMEVYYDIEVHSFHPAVDEYTTVLSGKILIKRSISGRVI